jgi:hypothetical protein
VVKPALAHEDFAAAVGIAQAEFERVSCCFLRTIDGV